MVHVGVDLHKRVSQIAVLTAEGEITQHRLGNEVESLERFFTQLPPKTPVAIEASGTWWWLVDLLERLGHQPVLSHPKQTKAIAAARLKNDRVDARRLALLLRGISYPPCGFRRRSCARPANSFATACSSGGSAGRSAIAWSPCWPDATSSRPPARVGSRCAGSASSRACHCRRSPAACARTTVPCCRCSMRRSASSMANSPSGGGAIPACNGCVRSPARAVHRPGARPRTRRHLPLCAC